MTIEPRSTTITIASLIFVSNGLLYVVGSIPVTAKILIQRTLPVIFGIPFYSGSFFARMGMSWVIASSFLFIFVGVADIVIGLLLWRSFKSGVYLAVAIFPIIMAISIGGEAPVPIIVEPIKLLLVILGWSSLH